MPNVLRTIDAISMMEAAVVGNHRAERASRSVANRATTRRRGRRPMHIMDIRIDGSEHIRIDVA